MATSDLRIHSSITHYAFILDSFGRQRRAPFGKSALQVTSPLIVYSRANQSSMMRSEPSMSAIFAMPFFTALVGFAEAGHVLIACDARCFAHGIFQISFARYYDPRLSRMPTRCFEFRVRFQLNIDIFIGSSAEPQLAAVFSCEAERANTRLRRLQRTRLECWLNSRSLHPCVAPYSPKYPMTILTRITQASPHIK